MYKSFLTKYAILFFIPVLFFGGIVIVTQAEISCPDNFDGLTKEQLMDALVACEKESMILEANIEKTGKEKTTLARDITLLNNKIKQAKLAIKMRTVSINNLTEDIVVKNKTIGGLSSKIERERDSLGGLLRRTDEIDSYSLLEFALSDQPLSEFFADIDDFKYIEEAIYNSLVEIGATKKQTEEEKTLLEQKKTKEADLRYQQELEKKKTEANEAEKQRILRETKGKEVAYQKELKVKQTKAAQIRAALFSLRDTEGIPFEKALEYANIASKATNVRSALILAILTQESDLGKNVGSCLVADLDTGDGVGKNTGTVFSKVMKSPRDTSPFKEIVDRLGFDWKKTPVSCPPQARYYSGRGFGGGMGPAQFIPSTWELFKVRIASAV